MKKIYVLFVLFVALAIISCSVVPFTGRKQLNIVPESEMIEMGLASYTEFIKGNPVSSDRANVNMVREVGTKLSDAIAQHGNERMSQQLLLQFGNVALSEVIKNKPEETKNIYNSVYGLGAQYGVMLPYSRKNEYEADKIGLIYGSGRI